MELLHTGEGHHLGVLSVDVDRKGALAASSSLDSQVRIWDLESGKQFRYIDAGPVDAWTLAFSPDSRHLASGSHTGNVHLFGVESGKKETSLSLDGKFTLSIAYVSFYEVQFIFGLVNCEWLPKEGGSLKEE